MRAQRNTIVGRWHVDEGKINWTSINSYKWINRPHLSVRVWFFFSCCNDFFPVYKTLKPNRFQSSTFSYTCYHICVAIDRYFYLIQFDFFSVSSVSVLVFAAQACLLSKLRKLCNARNQLFIIVYHYLVHYTNWNWSTADTAIHVRVSSEENTHTHTNEHNWRLTTANENKSILKWKKSHNNETTELEYCVTRLGSTCTNLYIIFHTQYGFDFYEVVFLLFDGNLIQLMIMCIRHIFEHSYIYLWYLPLISWFHCV